MSGADESMLRDRFATLGGENDGDWADVRRRARDRARRFVLLAAAAVVALVATGFGLGGRVIGLFADHGKPVPLSAFPARDRELLVTSLCHRLAFSQARGKAPRQVCVDGAPTVEEIARNDSEIHWRVHYPWGVTCIASGPVGGYHDPNRGDFRIGELGCNVGAPHTKLVPTPKRPITVDMSMITDLRTHRRARLVRVTGLAGEGVGSVGLVPRQGAAFKVPVHGRSYSLTSIPDRKWIAVVAYGASGKEVYREPVELPTSRYPVPFIPRHVRHRFPIPPKLPTTPPVQRGSSPTASVSVYRAGVVSLRFASTGSEAYRMLSRSSPEGVNLSCGKVAFGGGRWQNLAGGVTARLAPEVRVLISTRWGGMPSPPFDYCELVGTYGRYWNDEEGTNELVEVPFSTEGRRFLDDRSVARDLAYFERTRKMWRIRKAVHRGEQAPSAPQIARLFGPRVVPLARRDATGPRRKVGVWTDGRVIVASEPAPDGRRLFVTIRGVLIGTTNIRDLAFPF